MGPLLFPGRSPTESYYAARATSLLRCMLSLLALVVLVLIISESEPSSMRSIPYRTPRFAFLPKSILFYPQTSPRHREVDMEVSGTAPLSFGHPADKCPSRGCVNPYLADRPSKGQACRQPAGGATFTNSFPFHS